ncbi:MAG TPA: ribulose-phosphate 3-epimerase [Candidatus Aminicenantes bacterium]|nr:ribulose-phosphate 3-epimerase [Candidatus Aminicenantes bacterium]
MSFICPSILSTRFFDLEARLKEMVSCGIDVIHLDVMDGHFVEAISFGPSLCRAIKERFPVAIDAHLMVDQPDRQIPQFVAAGADWISLHAEWGGDIPAALRQIRSAGRRAGLVVNPDTPPERFYTYLDEVDYALVMSVVPGRGGQAFLPGSLSKVENLRREVNRRGLACVIQVDGGIQLPQVKALRQAGADLLVIGTFLYGAADLPGRVAAIDHEWSST